MESLQLSRLDGSGAASVQRDNPSSCSGNPEASPKTKASPYVPTGRRHVPPLIAVQVNGAPMLKRVLVGHGEECVHGRRFSWHMSAARTVGSNESGERCFGSVAREEPFSTPQIWRFGCTPWMNMVEEVNRPRDDSRLYSVIEGSSLKTPVGTASLSKGVVHLRQHRLLPRESCPANISRGRKLVATLQGQHVTWKARSRIHLLRHSHMVGQIVHVLQWSGPPSGWIIVFFELSISDVFPERPPRRCSLDSSLVVFCQLFEPDTTSPCVCGRYDEAEHGWLCLCIQSIRNRSVTQGMARGLVLRHGRCGHQAGKQMRTPCFRDSKR